MGESWTKSWGTTDHLLSDKKDADSEVSHHAGSYETHGLLHYTTFALHLWKPPLKGTHRGPFPEPFLYPELKLNSTVIWLLFLGPQILHIQMGTFILLSSPQALDKDDEIRILNRVIILDCSEPNDIISFCCCFRLQPKQWLTEACLAGFLVGALFCSRKLRMLLSSPIALLSPLCITRSPWELITHSWLILIWHSTNSLPDELGCLLFHFIVVCACSCLLLSQTIPSPLLVPFLVPQFPSHSPLCQFSASRQECK